IFSSGAPEHLRTALKVCVAHLNRLNEEMKQLLADIESGTEFLDFQQCLDCLRLVQKEKYCNYCGNALAKTQRIWRKVGGWDEDFDENETATGDENEMSNVL